MNKHIKKKWSRIAKLETKVAQLMAENILLTESLKNQVKSYEELKKRVDINTLATNDRFSQLEAEIKNFCKEVEELKQLRKPWYKRR